MAKKKKEGKEHEHAEGEPKTSSPGGDGAKDETASRRRTRFCPTRAICPSPSWARRTYERELGKLHIELVKMQEWVKAKGLQSGGDLRGAGCGGQGRDDQADHRDD